MAAAPALGAGARKGVGVRVPPSALTVRQTRSTAINCDQHVAIRTGSSTTQPLSQRQGFSGNALGNSATRHTPQIRRSLPMASSSTGGPQDVELWRHWARQRYQAFTVDHAQALAEQREVFGREAAFVQPETLYAFL